MLRSLLDRIIYHNSRCINYKIINPNVISFSKLNQDNNLISPNISFYYLCTFPRTSIFAVYDHAILFLFFFKPFKYLLELTRLFLWAEILTGLVREVDAFKLYTWRLYTLCITLSTLRFMLCASNFARSLFYSSLEIQWYTWILNIFFFLNNFWRTLTLMDLWWI